MNNIHNKWIIRLSIIILTSLISPTMSYGMKRPREEGNKELHEEFKLLIPEVQQNIQNFMLHNAIIFLAKYPIILNGITKIKISGNKIVTVSTDDSAKIWSIEDRQLKLLQTINGLDGNPARVTSIAIQDNNVAIGSLNDSAKIWHINNGQVQLLHTLTAPNINTENATAVAISGNKVVIESQFLGVGRSGMTMWDIHTGALLKANTFLNAIDGIFIQDLAIGNNHLVAFLSGGMIIIWDMNTNKNGRLTPQNIAQHSQAISGDRGIAIVQGTVKIWDTTAVKELGTIRGNRPNQPIIPILDAAISGNNIISSLGNGTVKVTKIDAGLQLRLSTTNNHALTSLGVSDTAAVGVDEQNAIAKIWLLSPPLEGTIQNNPLVWIKEKATMSQANVIKQAYEATIAGQEFILDRKDLQTFSELPMPVKRYLLNRLRINIGQ